jgi:hypothetical protein
MGLALWDSWGELIPKSFFFYIRFLAVFVFLTQVAPPLKHHCTLLILFRVQIRKFRISKSIQWRIQNLPSYLKVPRRSENSRTERKTRAWWGKHSTLRVWKCSLKHYQNWELGTHEVCFLFYSFITGSFTLFHFLFPLASVRCILM